MEYKSYLTNDCKERIVDLILELIQHGNDFIGMIDYPLYHYYYQFVIQKLMLDAMMEIDDFSNKVEIAIMGMGHYQNRQATYEIFTYFLENYYVEFILFLQKKMDHDLSDVCNDVLKWDFPEFSEYFKDENNRNEFCSNFNTVEDFIRLFPAVYNCLVDAFNVVAYNKDVDIIRGLPGLSEYPLVLINLITQYKLKYDKSVNDDSWNDFW